MAGFGIAGVLIYESVVNWNEDQTVTTLQSIATPIQETRFPTVTVCPHEDSPPDNWSYLEKILNAFAFSDQLRHEMNNIFSELLERLMAKFRAYPKSKAWIHNFGIDLSSLYGDLITDAANLVCKKDFSVKKLKAIIAENFMKDLTFEELIKLFYGDGDNDEYDYHSLGYFKECENKCCENIRSKNFFVSIINAGYYMYYKNQMGLGTFLSNFANI